MAPTAAAQYAVLHFLEHVVSGFVKGAFHRNGGHVLQAQVAGALRELRGLRKLQRLSLADCGLVRSLEPLAELPSLTHLELNHCSIDVDGLEPLRHAACLREIELFCKLVMFKNAIPECATGGLKPFFDRMAEVPGIKKTLAGESQFGELIDYIVAFP